jgi:hypothetical protein
LTTYNWGDIGIGTNFGLIEARNWKISPEDVKHYLRLCSPKHPVKYMFRGHEHKQQHHFHNEKLLISTMPLGMDGNPTYMNREHWRGQKDTFYVLETAPKVKEWSKWAVVREPGQSTYAKSGTKNIRDPSI